MRIKYFVVILVVLLFPLSGFSKIPGKFEIMVPYIPPAENSLDQVRIYEVFAFDCIHCYNFHKNQFQKLKSKFGDKIKFIWRPIGWRGHDPGRLFFIAQQKGKDQPVMDMIFDFIHEKGIGKGMFTRDKLQFVAKLNGLSNEFQSLMDNPNIVSKMNKSVQYAADRNINSTPTFVIEDKIIVKGNFSNMVTIINALLKEPVL